MGADLCRAIRDQRVIKFVYNGGIRRVEPYCHGFSDEQEVLLGRQSGGFTESKDKQLWRLYRTSTILRHRIVHEAHLSLAATS